MVKYWLPITANLLPMHLNILAGHNFQILLSTNDLPIVTNALFLLPMFCHDKTNYLFLPIWTNHDWKKFC